MSMCMCVCVCVSVCVCVCVVGEAEGVQGKGKTGTGKIRGSVGEKETWQTVVEVEVGGRKLVLGVVMV